MSDNMRILWVTQNGGNYKNPTVTGTGGWIGAMQEAFCKRNPEVELGITFFHPFDNDDVSNDSVSYLPVEYDYGKTPLKKWIYRHSRNEEQYLNERVLAMRDKVVSFHPDIVHIWGVEDKHAQLINYLTDIPSVVHIQGFASACLFSYFAPGFSVESLKSADKYLDRVFFKRGETFEYRGFVSRAERETKLVPKVKNWIGRTDWDRTVSQLLSPDSRYFHCDELLRSSFTGNNWEYHYNGKILNIQSTISYDWYKGMDIILKTALVLKEIGVSVCWNIYGWEKENKKIGVFTKTLGINPNDVGVYLKGCVDGSEIKNGLLSCDCYVHTSYIENSSNAIAEAQLLGVPVIAQNVGGTPTMLRDDSGMLVTPNDPYVMASKILEITKQEISEFYSLNAKTLAKKRHNPDVVCGDLMNIYNAIIETAD